MKSNTMIFFLFVTLIVSSCNTKTRSIEQGSLVSAHQNSIQGIWTLKEDSTIRLIIDKETIISTAVGVTFSLVYPHS